MRVKLELLQGQFRQNFFFAKDLQKGEYHEKNIMEGKFLQGRDRIRWKCNSEFLHTKLWALFIFQDPQIFFRIGNILLLLKCEQTKQ